MSETVIRSSLRAAESLVATLKTQLDAMVVKPWFPESGKKYFALDGQGLLLERANRTESQTLADGKFGGLFKYRKSAEGVAKKRAVHNYLERLAASLNKGWSPDWANSREQKFFLFYDHDEGKVRCNFADTFHRFGVVYFKSMSDAFKAYRSLSADQKKVFRGL